MQDISLYDAIRTTRAIRRLKTDPVDPQIIRRVCEAATFAPSGGNRQPWKFIAVTQQPGKDFIAQRYQEAFDGYIAPAIKAAEADGYPEAKKRNLKAALHLAHNIANAPVLLLVAGWTRRQQPQTQALFPAIQNLLLACRAEGLGASLTTVHRAYGEEIDQHFGLPNNCPSCALIPIGWPLGKYGQPPRRSIDESLHWERYQD